MKTDPDYLIARGVEKIINSTPEYKYYKSETSPPYPFKLNQKEYKIYSLYLRVFLFSKKVEAIVPGPGAAKKQIINGTAYLTNYIEGYEAGIKYFQKNFSPELYGGFTNEYIKDINHQLNEGRIKRDWVKAFIPVIINSKRIHDYGYYSGIVSQVDEIINTHPSLFNKTNHKPSEEPLTYSQIALIEFLNGREITKDSARDLLDPNYQYNYLKYLEKPPAKSSAKNLSDIEFAAVLSLSKGSWSAGRKTLTGWEKEIKSILVRLPYLPNYNPTVVDEQYKKLKEGLKKALERTV